MATSGARGSGTPLGSASKHHQQNCDQYRDGLVSHALLHQRLRSGRVEGARALSHSDKPSHEDKNCCSGSGGKEEDEEDLHEADVGADR